MAELKICRICLRTEVKMYNLNQFNLKRFLEEIMSYELDLDDYLPRVVCYECAMLLHKFNKFREKCYLGRHILLEINENGHISYEKVQKTSKSTNKLKSPLKISEIVTSAFPLTLGNSDSIEDIKTESSTVKLEINLYDEGLVDDSNMSFDEQTVPVDDGDTVDEKPLDDEDQPLSLLINSKNVKKKQNDKSKRKKRKVKKDISQVLDKEHWKIYFLNEEEAQNEFLSRAKTGYFTRAAFKCADCFKGFSREEMLIIHRKRMHSEENNLKECKFCKMRFKFDNRLQKHLRGHYTRFQCLRCKTQPIFNLEGSATLHNEAHADSTKTCLHCGKEFKHLSTLYTHLRRHRSRHVCGACGGGFVSAAGLRQHASAKHYGDHHQSEDEEARPLHCAACDVTFSSRAALLEHYFHSDMHETGSYLEDQKVTNMQKVFGKKTRKQIAEKLGIAEEYEKKDASFQRMPLKDRKTKRSPNKPTTCRHCGQTFTGLVKCIKHHRREHPGRPFHDEAQRHVCEICGAVLAPGSVNAHLNMHSREKLHACETCGRQFTQPSTLKRHTLTHSGLRPWPCAVCGKAFTQSNSLKLHHRTVHLKQPHPRRNRYSKKLAVEMNAAQLSKEKL